MARADDGRGPRDYLFRSVPRAESRAADLGRPRLARRERRGGGTGDARLASAACREILERRVRGRDHSLRRVPRRGAGRRQVFMSAYPLVLEGSALSAVIAGGGRVATR